MRKQFNDKNGNPNNTTKIDFSSISSLSIHNVINNNVTRQQMVPSYIYVLLLWHYYKVTSTAPHSVYRELDAPCKYYQNVFFPSILSSLPIIILFIFSTVTTECYYIVGTVCLTVNAEHSGIHIEIWTLFLYWIELEKLIGPWVRSIKFFRENNRNILSGNIRRHYYWHFFRWCGVWCLCMICRRIYRSICTNNSDTFRRGIFLWYNAVKLTAVFRKKMCLTQIVTSCWMFNSETKGLRSKTKRRGKHKENPCEWWTTYS